MGLFLEPLLSAAVNTERIPQVGRQHRGTEATRSIAKLLIGISSE